MGTGRGSSEQGVVQSLEHGALAASGGEDHQGEQGEQHWDQETWIRPGLTLSLVWKSKSGQVYQVSVATTVVVGENTFDSRCIERCVILTALKIAVIRPWGVNWWTLLQHMCDQTSSSCRLDFLWGRGPGKRATALYLWMYDYVQCVTLEVHFFRSLYGKGLQVPTWRCTSWRSRRRRRGRWALRWRMSRIPWTTSTAEEKLASPSQINSPLRRAQSTRSMFTGWLIISF